MLSFTLDTNCIIALDEGRPEATAVRELARAHADGRATVAVAAIMASERQRPHSYLENFETFQDRLRRLGVGHLSLALPLGYWDITFWDHSLWGSNESAKLERQIHNVLFSKIHFDFVEHCEALGVEPDAAPSEESHIWRNAKCDVLALWSHINSGHSVFVTSDKGFHEPSKQDALRNLGVGRVEFPSGAAQLLLGG